MFNWIRRHGMAPRPVVPANIRTVFLDCLDFEHFPRALPQAAPSQHAFRCHVYGAVSPRPDAFARREHGAAGVCW